MLRRILALGLAASLVPAAAHAQAGDPLTEPGSYRVRRPGIQAPPTAYEVDLDYCRRLAGLYLRYVGSDMGSNGTLIRRTDPEGNYAVTRCEQGDPVAAIPILERKLVNNRFTLPPRS